MALRTEGEFDYGDGPEDTLARLGEIAGEDGYGPDDLRSAEVSCACCRGRLFRVSVDADLGVAVRTCRKCHEERAVADGTGWLDRAEPADADCPGCGAVTFELAVLAALYDDSDDVRRTYLAGRCVRCGLVLPLADWDLDEGMSWDRYAASL